MLPVVNEEIYKRIVEEALIDIGAWRKKMIHYIKDENPEINSAIIDLAQQTQLDPKAVATGAYMAYMLLEHASEESEDAIILEE